MTEPRYARSDFTLANAFTGVRLVLIPIFGYLWATGSGNAALWVFAIAALTDLIDGFLARYLNQRSRLGALLDPIADKFLMLVALVVGVLRGAVPGWLAVCVIGRDALLALFGLGFALRWKGRHDPEAWHPTRLGKYAMFLQTATIFGAILDDIVAPPGFRPYLQIAMILAALLTVVAGAQYAARALGAVRLFSQQKGTTP